MPPLHRTTPGQEACSEPELNPNVTQATFCVLHLSVKHYRMLDKSASNLPRDLI